MDLADDMLASRFCIAHRLDGEQRRLSLHVVDVLRIVDAGVAHGVFDGGGDLLDHRGPADIFRKQHRTHRGAHRQPRFRSWAGLAVAREDCRVWGDDAVAAAGPHHRDLVDRLFAPLAVLEQHAAERLVGEDAGEVVYPAISLGLANNSNDFVGRKGSAGDTFFKARGVGNRLQFDFKNFDSHLLPDLGLVRSIWSGVPPGPDAAQFFDSRNFAKEAVGIAHCHIVLFV